MTTYPGRKGYRPYNGFWPPIREQSTINVAAAYRDGRLKPTHRCSVCEQRFDKPVGLHVEDYSQPLLVYPICRKCHMVLHLRFWQPTNWHDHIRTLNPQGWFQMLRCDPETLSRPFGESYPNGIPPYTSESAGSHSKGEGINVEDAVQPLAPFRPT